MVRIATLLVLSVLANAEAIAAEPRNPVASAMIDPTIFREGQVRRLSGRFGAWSALCDEVPALRQRFCSLRSATASDNRGRPLFLDVSTGDDGKPAVLIHLPHEISLSTPIRIAVRSQSGERASQKLGGRASVAVCSSQECLAVWNIDRASIAALNGGGNLLVSYCLLRPGFSPFRPSLGGGTCEVQSTSEIAGRGFSDAVSATLN